MVTFPEKLAAAPRIILSLIRLGLHLPITRAPFAPSAGVITVDLRNPGGLAIYRYRKYHDPDLELLRRFLAPGSTFVDCGANVGYFTMMAAKIVGPTGHVWAFEPSPNSRNALLQNVSANAYSQVSVLPFALSSAAGKEKFTDVPRGGGTSSFAPAPSEQGVVIDVDTIALDDLGALFGSSPALIKIDVEGAEMRLLRGAARFFADHRPSLLIEVEDAHLRRQGSNAAELYAQLASYGYQPSLGAAMPPNVLFLHQQGA